MNNKRKCFKMHIGDVKVAFPKLKVQSEDMLTSNRGKYLGDILVKKIMKI